VSDYADETIDKLVKRAKDRCLWAVRKDGRLALEDEKHIQTVGGNVRIAFIENKNK
jgi:molecular chaperone DnaK (HSP70)